MVLYIFIFIFLIQYKRGKKGIWFSIFAFSVSTVSKLHMIIYTMISSTVLQNEERHKRTEKSH
jgi:hypothetical protein